MREAGLRCAEKIVAWVLAASSETTASSLLQDDNGDNAELQQQQQQQQQQPMPFLWQGQDYLLKVSLC